MKQKATIKDVASLAGVSFKTVSRVINNEDAVADAMKEKVWAAIKALEYTPNLSARGLRGAASAIGFIYDNPNSNYVIDMQSGILTECRAQGYELIIHPCNADAGDLVTEVMAMIHRSRVGGLVLTPPLSEDTAILQQLAALHVRFVRIVSGSQAPDHLSPCVYIDDRTAAYNITEHLLNFGHRKIAFLGGDEEHASSGERLAGYQAALRAHGIEPDNQLFLPGKYAFESGVERTRALLSREQRPSAVFACNDEIAAGTLFAARIAGIDVPGQLSIAGFEDSPFSRQAWPNLTTAQQPTRLIAQRATALLINSLRADKRGQVIDSEGFLPELLCRESTGPRP